MALEYAIEKLQETNTIQDSEHAAVLSGILATRGGVDIALPSSTELSPNPKFTELQSYAGKVGMMLADDADSAPHVISSDELDKITTEKYQLANAAKELLAPYYTAASYKLPLRDADGPKNWRGKPKVKEANLAWSATSSALFQKVAITSRGGTESLPVRRDMELTYTKSKTGNTPTELESQLHVSGKLESAKNATLALEFSESSVTAVSYTRGRYDLRGRAISSPRSLIGFPDILNNALEAKFDLDPNNLSVQMKFEDNNKSSTVKYIFDPTQKCFIATDYDKQALKDASLPLQISKAKYLATLSDAAEVFIPTK